jgi:hypothetical protein
MLIMWTAGIVGNNVWLTGVCGHGRFISRLGKWRLWGLQFSSSRAATWCAVCACLRLESHTKSPGAAQHLIGQTEFRSGLLVGRLAGAQSTQVIQLLKKKYQLLQSEQDNIAAILACYTNSS